MARDLLGITTAPLSRWSPVHRTSWSKELMLMVLALSHQQTAAHIKCCAMDINKTAETVRDHLCLVISDIFTQDKINLSHILHEIL